MPRHASAHSADLPYMEVQDQPRMMKGGPTSTVFGVLGMTKMEAPTRSLGGLIVTNTHPRPSGKADVRRERMLAAADIQTERGTLSAPSKTKVPGEHFGAVPFAGAYRSALGNKL